MTSANHTAFNELSDDEPASKRFKFEAKKNEVTASQQISENGVSLKRIRIGSRKSQLALFQSNFVLELLKQKHPDTVYEIIAMSTTGDKILNMPLSKIGEKSLFTKELEGALENGEVDMIVHSLKDLPTTLPPGMVIGAICRRENPHDAVVFSSDINESNLNSEKQSNSLGSLAKGSVIGTSSLRRIAQLKRSYPHLKFQSVRGNLNTRLRKLDEDKVYSALILAVAGLERMDMSHRISEELSPEICMYAVGQGALAVECKADDLSTLRLISHIADKETTFRCIAERAFMKTLEGGCSVPVAVCSDVKNDELTLKGGVFSLDGSKSIIESVSTKLNGKIDKADNTVNKAQIFCGVTAHPHLPQHLLSASEQLGLKLANSLLELGASNILAEARIQNLNP